MIPRRYKTNTCSQEKHVNKFCDKILTVAVIVSIFRSISLLRIYVLKYFRLGFSLETDVFGIVGKCLLKSIEKYVNVYREFRPILGTSLFPLNYHRIDARSWKNRFHINQPRWIYENIF